jgi:hypothetical protein
MILILAILQSRNILSAIRKKEFPQIKRYILQSVLTLVLFIVFSMPLLYFVVGKYHLHFLNRLPSELVEELFIFRNMPQLLKMNLTVGVAVALVGVVWVIYNVRQPVIRPMILSWPLITIFLFVYSTAVSSLDRNYDIHLPATVPSFHYFFYLKSAQSVFFGLGFTFLIQLAIRKWSALRTPALQGYIYLILIFVFAAAYFPVYRNRRDFTWFREKNLEQNKYTDRISAYNYIVKNIPQNDVILCEEDTELFPLMPTARKMVCIGIPYSNPYVDFWQRQSARDTMLASLKTGQPAGAKQLFDKFEVNYILLSNATFGPPATPGLQTRLEFKTDSFSLYRIIK